MMFAIGDVVSFHQDPETVGMVLDCDDSSVTVRFPSRETPYRFTTTRVINDLVKTGTGALPDDPRFFPAPPQSEPKPETNTTVFAATAPILDVELGKSWEPIELGDVVQGLLDGTIKRPTPTIGRRNDGAYLFYAGRVNGIAGQSGCGKSWTAMLTAVQEIWTSHVFYIDMEDDKVSVVTRLLDLGAHPDDITSRFHYIHPDEAFSTYAAQLLVARLTQFQPTLVVIDSTGEAMAMNMVRPNDDDDVARWFRALPGMIAATGPAVVVLDHVTKAALRT